MLFVSYVRRSAKILILNKKGIVVLRTMRIVEPADRIPFPISRGCDLPMVSFLPHLEVLQFGGNVGLVNCRRREVSRA